MAKNEQAISPQDVEGAETIFKARGFPEKEIAFCYNSITDKWELHRAEGGMALVLVATRNPKTNEWAEV